MKKILITLLALSAMTFASDRRREAIQEEQALLEARQELTMWRQKFEDLRVNRWQDKRNSVARKEAFQGIYDELRRDVEKLQTTKNQKEETLMRVQNQQQEAEKEVSELEGRIREFGVQITEKLTDFNKDLVTAFPVDLTAHKSKTEKLLLDLQERNYQPTVDLIAKIFSQQLEVFKNNEARKITRTTMPMQGFAAMADGRNDKISAGMVAGYKISLGGIYQGFASTETKDAAILAKTGRIDSQAWDWVESILPEKREKLNAVATQLANGEQDKPLLIPLDVQLRKAVGEGYSSAVVSTFWKDLIEELKGAGFVIYGMGTLVFLGLWILSDKIRVFSTRGRHGKKFTNEIFTFLDNGKMQDAINYAKRHDGSVPYIFRAVLKAAKKGKSREEVENIAYERILHETPIVEKNIGTINIFAAAAPLMGLLGTVSGMVNLFAAITLHGTSDPKIMAAGIAEALLSTKWGLIVAIPLLLMYNWVNNQAAKVVSNMEKYTARLVNHLYGVHEIVDVEDVEETSDELSSEHA